MVVCGSTHTQFERSIGGKRVINSGSVGRPYEDARRVPAGTLRPSSTATPTTPISNRLGLGARKRYSLLEHRSRSRLTPRPRVTSRTLPQASVVVRLRLVLLVERADGVDVHLIQNRCRVGSNNSTGFSPLTSCASFESVMGVAPKVAGSPCLVRTVTWASVGTTYVRRRRPSTMGSCRSEPARPARPRRPRPGGVRGHAAREPRRIEAHLVLAVFCVRDEMWPKILSPHGSAAATRSPSPR